MKQTKVRQGSRVVIITEDMGCVSARLYLNVGYARANGETASLQCWRGKTLAGAQRWAKKILAA
jgi:hypothetical protein